MQHSRRAFLLQASILSAGIAMPKIALASSKKTFPLGLQLYTIREAMEKDLRGTLQRVSSFGYQEVETYGFNYGRNKYYWGLEPKAAKQLLDDCNLTTPAGHYDLNFFFAPSQADALKKYVDECIAGAHALQQQYIVWPWLAPEYRNIESFKRLANTLNTIGEQIKKGGLQLAYHNHDFEFIEEKGQIGYDIITQETDPNFVTLELDLYWLSHSSKKKAAEWFKAQPGRFAIFHLKDMDKKDRELHTTMGDGQIDFRAILKDYKLAGVQHMFVEQGNNYIPDAMTNVQRSAQYVKKNFLHI
ncbi:sugar phosphate isomerase/epimerase [Chitinophaga skermanii]|uniref:Sugar phosphate isomerase/epimerase n=1 Tax=Chitinophaga skermanii TaxID=331697 RepID=A0A327QCJ7_9BACT|nr:sugar phosphate isomerase/epimerase [Chitinophaga skermanii]RAJ02386.1 sugar phosphate isomerase/epimerase [Chitinophaga skermanii]